MTANKAMERVAAIKPHAYSDETLQSWIAELDGKISHEVMRLPQAVKYSYPVDNDLPLLALPPYDNIYELYICAMIDFSNREYGNYQNSMAMFNAAYSEFCTQYLRVHCPAPAKQFTNIM